MATQQFAEEEQRMMNLTRLQSEVSAGTYKFARPLTIVACATQEKYVVYIYRARSVPKVSSAINKATIVQFTNGRDLLRTDTTCVSSCRTGSAQKPGSVYLTKWQ